MNKFFKAALGVAGIGAVAFFVFFSLYREWLKLSIFAALTPDQTFALMMVFLVLTFVALIAGLVAWMVNGRSATVSEPEALERLEKSWEGVRYLDCEKLVGPDVARAADALRTTSVYWRRGYLTKQDILEKHGRNYCDLFEQLEKCKKLVPGYEKLGKSCSDFIDAPMRATYSEIKPRIP